MARVFLVRQVAFLSCSSLVVEDARSGEVLEGEGAGVCVLGREA